MNQSRKDKIETAICLLQSAGMDGAFIQSLKNRVAVIEKEDKE